MIMALLLLLDKL